MKKVVTIFTGLAKIDKNLVGTAVIYKKLAELFRDNGYAVNLVLPDVDNVEKIDHKVSLCSYNENINKKLIKNSSLVVFGAHPPIRPMLFASRQKKKIMTYLWSIAPIGSLDFEDFSDKKKQQALHEYIIALYNLSLLLSDKLFCRNTEAKRIILGSLISLGKVNLENYSIDSSLDNLLEEAPFGIEDDFPVHKENIYKGILPGVSERDFIIIWNGGLWNRSDGKTLVRAMGLLKKNKKIKLVFQGFKHPDNSQKMTREARETMALAKKLGLLGKSTFFSSKWIPHEDRGSYLTECDLGVAISQKVADAMYLLKTRVYDNIWAGLPTIISDCDALAPLIENEKLGLVCKTGDEKDLADKILKLYKERSLTDKIKGNISVYRKKINWKKTLMPVSRFAKDPSNNKTSKDLSKLAREEVRRNLKIVEDYEKKKA